MESHSPENWKSRKNRKDQPQKDPHRIPTYSNVWSLILYHSYGFWWVLTNWCHKKHQQAMKNHSVVVVPPFKILVYPSDSFYSFPLLSHPNAVAPDGTESALSFPCFSAGPGWAADGTALLSCQAKGSTCYGILWRERKGWKPKGIQRYP